MIIMKTRVCLNSEMVLKHISPKPFSMGEVNIEFTVNSHTVM